MSKGRFSKKIHWGRVSTLALVIVGLVGISLWGFYRASFLGDWYEPPGSSQGSSSSSLPQGSSEEPSSTSDPSGVTSQTEVLTRPETQSGPWNLVLINDGKIVIKVEETTGTTVTGTVIHGGKISNHKGINLPNVNLKMEYISPQDRADILFGIENDVDYIAASFVRSAEDVLAIRKILEENGGSEIKIISKIESTQGIDNFEKILDVSDGIMVARGDMGVEVAYEKLPGIQKKFIRRCVQLPYSMAPQQSCCQERQQQGSSLWKLWRPWQR